MLTQIDSLSAVQAFAPVADQHRRVVEIGDEVRIPNYHPRKHAVPGIPTVPAEADLFIRNYVRINGGVVFADRVLLGDNLREIMASDGVDIHPNVSGMSGNLSDPDWVTLGLCVANNAALIEQINEVVGGPNISSGTGNCFFYMGLYNILGRCSKQLRLAGGHTIRDGRTVSVCIRDDFDLRCTCENFSSLINSVLDANKPLLLGG